MSYGAEEHLSEGWRRYVLALDHRIPNGMPLEAYRFYIAKAWEIMDREAAQQGQKN